MASTRAGLLAAVGSRPCDQTAGDHGEAGSDQAGTVVSRRVTALAAANGT
jgi:hypothetical protein